MSFFRLFMVVFLAPLFACSPVSRDTRTDDIARVQLEAMLDSDQALRAEIQAVEGKLGANSTQAKELWARQGRADQENVKNLIHYVESKGWPSQSVVGEKAATAAFLVMQHADLQLQQKLLPLLRESAAKGEFKPHRLAMLEDRIAVRTGKAQLYGTQVVRNPTTGIFHFSPIADEANVEKRREAVGLEPLAEYAKGFGFEYSPGPSK